jgi:putative MATE family efflux protein
MPLSPKQLFKTIRESFRGEHRDFTEGEISEAVILLAIPMILELSLEGVFAVVDMFFVSRLGANAIATVGLTESVATIIYSVAMGLGMAATAMVARRTGEKNPEGAAHAGAQAILLSLVGSLILGLIGASLGPQILAFMGAGPDVIAVGGTFSRIMLGGCIPAVFLFLINGIFRGAGDAAMAMRSLWLASGMNIVLCPIFIHFFGLNGAALATFVGRSSGVAYQCYHLFKGGRIPKIGLRHFGIDLPVLKSLVHIAWPASIQFLIGSGSWIILTRLVAETGGTAASAGYQIAFRNFIFFILPAWGLSNAAATLVGQNLGAKKYERAEQSVTITAIYSAAAMAVVTLIFAFLSAPIVQFFTTDPEVLGYGVQALRIIGAGYIFYGVGMVMSQALNGAGDTKTPTWINFFCFWVFQTPFAYFLAKSTSYGAHGAVLAIPAAHALLAVIAWCFFKMGRWKTVQV